MNLIKDKNTFLEVNQIKFDQMVYIRLFEGCNLYCEHCFIPSNPKKIDPSFYNNNGLTECLIKEANIKIGDTLFLQWHGGEPTLLGCDYLENAINEVEKDKRFKYIHGIQTNLINFSEKTEKWIDLYKKKFNSSIGVSWDLGIRHIKRKEQNKETNNNYEEIFWKNVKLATDNSIDIYLVVTATKVFFEHFKNPIVFFELLVKNNINKVNFERITKTGIARDNWDYLGLTNLEYSNYMSKFYKYYLIFKKNYFEQTGKNINISPFDGLENSVFNLMKNKQELIKLPNFSEILSFKNQGYGCWSGECDTKFHTIDSNGYKHGCTALTSEQDNKNIKFNINDSKKIIWLGKNNIQQKENIIKNRKERQNSCNDCEFISICSSGCLTVEKFDESKECSGAKILFEEIKKYYLKNI